MQSANTEILQATEAERDYAFEETSSANASLKEEAKARRILLKKLDEWERFYRSDPKGQMGKMYQKMLAQWDRHVGEDVTLLFLNFMVYDFQNIFVRPR